MVLKGIPPIISPDLLKILAEMGHGDMIVFADAHFPGNSIANKNNLKVVREDGIGSIPKLLEGVLKVFEMDAYVSDHAKLMDLTDGDKKNGVIPPNWQLYRDVISKELKMMLIVDDHDDDDDNTKTTTTTENKKEPKFQFIERFDFYKKAAEAYCIVMTGDTSIYGNIILTKGVTPLYNYNY